MFSFHSKYFVYRELKRAPQKLRFCFQCPDTGTVRILGNILYVFLEELVTSSSFADYKKTIALLMFTPTTVYAP